MDHSRALAREPGIAGELVRRCRKAEEDPVLDFNGRCYREIEYGLLKGGGKGGELIYFRPHPPIPRAASTSDPKPFDAIAVPPLLYEAANDATSKFPLTGVSPDEETLSCETSEAVDAVEVMVALVAANELMFTLDSFEVPAWESKVFASVLDEGMETVGMDETVLVLPCAMVVNAFTENADGRST